MWVNGVYTRRTKRELACAYFNGRAWRFVMDHYRQQARVCARLSGHRLTADDDMVTALQVREHEFRRGMAYDCGIPLCQTCLRERTRVVDAALHHRRHLADMVRQIRHQCHPHLAPIRPRRVMRLTDDMARLDLNIPATGGTP